MPYGRMGEIFAAVLGIATAVLLAGGWIVVRLQRDRQQSRLMQTALERGLTTLPGLAPAWVMSLRQGVMALALGVGILVMGRALCKMANTVEPLPAEAMAAGPSDGPARGTAPATMPGRMPPPPGMRDGQGPPGRDGPGRDGPGRDMAGRDGPPNQPPRVNPAMDRWQRIQTLQLTGFVSMSAGAILMLLGLVRIVFALLEKKYAIEAPASGATKV